ncbi:MAG: hypothetical protein IKT46_09525 [Clostridia bacterium]|nr:hypothetical protein [Clostridia bacterium]
MNEITNHAELTVEKKKEGKYMRNRILMYIGYAIAPILAIILLSIIIEGGALIGLIAIVPTYPFLLAKVIIPMTKPFIDIEEKMDISGGHLTLTTVYGRKKSKDLCKIKVSLFDAIAPYNNPEYKKAADDFKYDKRYEAVSSMAHPDVYYAYGTNEFGEKVICFFEVTNKGLKVMKFLNKKTVVTEVSR